MSEAARGFTFAGSDIYAANQARERINGALGHALYDNVSKQLGWNQLGPSQKDLCEQA